MTARLVVVAAAILLAGGLCGGDDKKGEKDDKDKLQGEWVVVSVDVAGKKADDVKDLKLVVKGDEWTPPSSKGNFKFTFKIDATKTPKQLDLMGLGGTWPGIYKIEGGTLTYCRSQGRGDERPKEFKGGPAVFLMVCKRVGK